MNYKDRENYWWYRLVKTAFIFLVGALFFLIAAYYLSSTPSEIVNWNKSRVFCSTGSEFTFSEIKYKPISYNDSFVRRKCYNADFASFRDEVASTFSDSYPLYDDNYDYWPSYVVADATKDPYLISDEVVNMFGDGDIEQFYKPIRDEVWERFSEYTYEYTYSPDWSGWIDWFGMLSITIVITFAIMTCISRSFLYIVFGSKSNRISK